MTVHAFVDESVRTRYVMAAALISPRDLAAARRSIGSLILPGQRRLHFCKERTSRRHAILSTVRALDLVDAVIYVAPTDATPRAARKACLERLVDDVVAWRGQRIVVEQDDSLMTSDRHTLYERLRAVNAEPIEYVHQRAREECLLAIPDTLAWCWTRGGHWRKALPAGTRVDRLTAP